MVIKLIAESLLTMPSYRVIIKIQFHILFQLLFYDVFIIYLDKFSRRGGNMKNSFFF